MGIKFSNNGSSSLAGALTTSATSFSVASGDGAKFPALGEGDWFPLTLSKMAGGVQVHEIVKVTARAGDTMTVTRAQEGSTVRAFAVGDRVELRPTAAALAEFATLTGSETLTNKTLVNAQLTGVPTAPTASAGTTGTQVANVDFVAAAIADGGGGGAMELLGSATVSAPVSYIDFLDVFAAGYDRFVVELVNVTPTVAGQLRLSLSTNALTVITSTNYRAATGEGTIAAGLQPFPVTNANVSTTNGVTATIDFLGVHESSIKPFYVHGGYMNGTTPTVLGRYGILDHGITAALTGFRLLWDNATTFSGGTVRVYGIKKS